MYLGKICEVASPDELFVRPRHPYTAILMSSIPVTDPSVDPREGDRRSAGELPSPDGPAVGLPLPDAVPAEPRSGAPRRSRCCASSASSTSSPATSPSSDGRRGRRRTGTEPTTAVRRDERRSGAEPDAETECSLRRPPASGSGGDPPCRGVGDGRGRLRQGVDARHGSPGRRQRRRPLLPLPVEARSAARSSSTRPGRSPWPASSVASSASATIRSPNSTRSSARSSPRTSTTTSPRRRRVSPCATTPASIRPSVAVIERQRQRLVDLIAEVIAAGVETGDFTIDEPVAAANAILTLTASVVGPAPRGPPDVRGDRTGAALRQGHRPVVTALRAPA